MYEPDVKAAKGVKNLVVTLVPEVDGLDMHYSFDNSFPDNYYPAYDGKSILVPVDATQLKVVSYKEEKAVGRTMVFPVADLKKRAK
jgi:hexosaminidase